ITLLSKSVSAADSASLPMIHLANSDELGQDSRLIFFLKTEVPDSFPASEKIEVATADEAFHVLLSLKDGNLTLQDSKTVFAMLDPIRLLGPSAFGPLKFRAVSGDGTEGEWHPLINLVRMPELKGVSCPAAPAMSAAKAEALSSDKASPDTECS